MFQVLCLLLLLVVSMTSPCYLLQLPPLTFVASCGICQNHHFLMCIVRCSFWGPAVGV